MRGSAIVVAGVAAALLAAASPSVASKSTPGRCGAYGAHTVKRNKLVRVYRTGAPTPYRYYYACLRGSRAKPIALTYGGIRAPESVSPIVVRGRYLTYVYTQCSKIGGCDPGVYVLDVKRRGTVAADEYLAGTVDAVVATPGGAAAYLGTDAGEHYIKKLDSLGISEIDRGANVRSLTLRGARLHWLHGTEQRSQPAAHVRRCGPTRGVDTFALARTARVYKRYDDGIGDRGRTYACLLPGGKPMFLADEDTSSTAYWYPDDFEIAGGHVVWLDYECFGSCNARVRSADLHRRTIRAGRYYPGQRTLRINGRGDAAELFHDNSSPPDYALLVFDSSGERQLDSGSGIDPASISIDAHALTWRRDGQERSEQLR